MPDKLAKPQPQTKIAIVVLPLVEISANAESEYLCDGITEEIINALSGVEQLRVISRTSSFYYKNKKYSISEVGERLGVEVVLEGSVRLVGERIRVSTQLVQVANDTQIWSMTWNRNTNDIFELQDEISLAIADKLRENFGHLYISDRLAQNATSNTLAYQNLLKGKLLHSKWNPEDVNASIAYFEKSIALDIHLVEAYTCLADCYSFLAIAGFAPQEAAWQKANEYMAEAKKRDPKNASLNYNLANKAFFTQANFSEAMYLTEQALASRPTHSEAQQFMSFLYLLQGEKRKAKQHLMYAKSIDPLSKETRFYEALFYYRTEGYELAEEILKELLLGNERNLPALIVLVYLYLRTNQSEQLAKMWTTLPDELVMPDERLGIECLLQFTQKQTTQAEKKLYLLAEHANDPQAVHAHAYLFIVYAFIGQNDNAFAVLEKLALHQSSILLLAFSDPLVATLRADKRYTEWHKKIYFTKSKTPRTRKTNSVLDIKTATIFLKRLYSFVETEKPMLDPTLTLRSLAQRIEIHPNQLSSLLNDSLGKNFNEYINSLRIEHFKKIAIDPTNANISLIGLAYESGFNSKTVFNTTFKRIEGITPKEYQKKHML